MAMELLDDQDDHGPFLDDVTLLEIANCPVRYVELSEECSYLPPDSTSGKFIFQSPMTVAST